MTVREDVTTAVREGSQGFLQADEEARIVDLVLEAIPSGVASGSCIPSAQLRAMIRLLYPEEMTPTAKRQLEAVCEVYEQEVMGR